MSMSLRKIYGNIIQALLLLNKRVMRIWWAQSSISLKWQSKAQDSLRSYVLHFTKKFCQTVGRSANPTNRIAACRPSLQGALARTSWRLPVWLFFFACLLIRVYIHAKISLGLIFIAADYLVAGLLGRGPMVPTSHQGHISISDD